MIAPLKFVILNKNKLSLNIFLFSTTTKIDASEWEKSFFSIAQECHEINYGSCLEKDHEWSFF